MYWTLKRMLSIAGIILITGTIVIYSYIQFRGVIEGPDIILDSPTSHMSTTTLILVRGHVKNAKSTTLQGRSIFIDTKGLFSEELLLSEGYNIIVLTAADAQGRNTRKAIEVFYENQSPLETPSSTSSPQIATTTESVIQ